MGGWIDGWMDDEWMDDGSMMEDGWMRNGWVGNGWMEERMVNDGARKDHEGMAWTGALTLDIGAWSSSFLDLITL